MKRSAWTILAAAALPALLACGSDPAESGRAAGVETRVDTVAGVVRVRNAGAPEPRSTRLVFEVGRVAGLEAGDPEEFGRVASVALDEEGRVLVADAAAGEIRVFDRDGRFLERWGRSGEGPGEFGMLYSLGWLGDTLAVLDPRVGRIGLLSSEGRWLDQLPYPGGVSGPTSMIRLYATGPRELWAWTLTTGEGGFERRFVRVGPTDGREHLPWVEAEGRAASSIRCPRPDGAITFFRIPFAPRLVQAPAAGGRLAAAWTAEYRIALLKAEGDTARTIERAHEPVPVGEDEWEAALAGHREFHEEWPGVACEPRMPGRPRTKPALVGLHPDAAGRLWVEVNAGNGRRFDLYDAEGRLLAEVPAPEYDGRVPPYFAPRRLAVVARDSLDVQRVRVYAIERG